MAQKSRDPDKISRDDLVTWSQDLVDWLSDHGGDPDLTPRAADFPPLAGAYEDAYHAALAPKQYAPLLHDELETAADSLIEILRELRIRIPLLPGVDESALADFGLGDPVPTDWDKLDAVANVCSAHWQGLGNPPEYAPLSGRMADMVAIAATFESKHSAYRAAIGDKQDAIYLRDQRRDTLLECEREIFNWYRGAYPDGDDDFWRTTPWGTTGEEGPEPEELEPPENFSYDTDNTEFSWDAVTGATGYELEISEDGTTWTNAYSGAETSFVKDDLTQGVWHARVRATAGTKKSAWSDVIELLIPFGKPNLQYKAIARLLWCDPVPGAINYQFQCDDPEMGIVQTGPNPTYVVPTPQTDDWKFRVRAGNMEGQWGEWSEWLLVPVTT